MHLITKSAPTLLLFAFFYTFISDANAQIPPPDYHKEAMSDAASKRSQEMRNGDDGGLFLLGVLLVGGVAYNAAESAGYIKSDYYSPKHKRRFVPKAPTFTFGAGITLFKNEINEHFESWISGDLKLEFLLVGNRGKYPHIGLYATGTLSRYMYELPFDERPYFLGDDFIADGTPGSFYPLTQTASESNAAKERILLYERFNTAGLSLRSIFESGFFFDIGGGLKMARSLKLNFGEDYNYLEGNAQLKEQRFPDIGIINSEPYVFGLKNSFLEGGLGIQFQNRETPFYVRLSSRLFQLDYSKSNLLNIYTEENSIFTPIDFDQKLGFSLSLDVAITMGRFTK